MARKPPRHYLTPEDEALWQQVASTVRPLKTTSKRASAGNVIPEARQRPAKTLAKKSWQTVAHSPLPMPDTSHKPVVVGTTDGDSAPKLNNSWSRKIRRGQFDAEARLDLHGLTCDQAFVILHRFLVRALDEGRRSLLVITGKGRRSKGAFADQSSSCSQGILKTEVPRWLRQGPLADHILSVQSAHPRDGGGGAYYVILRRDRTGNGRPKGLRR